MKTSEIEGEFLDNETLCAWHDKLLKGRTDLELQNKNNQITPWLYYFGKTIIEAQKQTIKQVDFVIAEAKFFSAYETLLNPRQKKAN